MTIEPVTDDQGRLIGVVIEEHERFWGWTVHVAKGGFRYIAPALSYVGEHDDRGALVAEIRREHAYEEG